MIEEVSVADVLVLLVPVALGSCRKAEVRERLDDLEHVRLALELLDAAELVHDSRWPCPEVGHVRHV